MKTTYLVIDDIGRLSYEAENYTTIIRIMGVKTPAMLKKVNEALVTLCPLGYDHNYYIPRPGNFARLKLIDKIKEIDRFEKALQNHIKESLLKPLKKDIIIINSTK